MDVQPEQDSSHDIPGDNLPDFGIKYGSRDDLIKALKERSV